MLGGCLSIKFGMVFLTFGGSGSGQSPRAHVHNASVSIMSRPSHTKGSAVSTATSEHSLPATSILSGLSSHEQLSVSKLEAVYRERWRCTLRGQMGLLQPIVSAVWWSRESIPSSVEEGTGETALNDEEWLLLRRFCAARQFNVDAAVNMLGAFVKWRIKWSVDAEICARGPLPQLETLRCHYPSGYYGVSRNGAPVYYDRAGRINVKELQRSMSEDSLIKVWIQMYEHSQQVVLPACSIAAGRRITQGITVMDLEGLGWSQMSGDARAVLKKLININQDNYPESMDLLFIVKAPMIVSGILKFVKTMLDKKTAAKIKVVSERGEALRKRLGEYIDPDQMPDFLFGIDDGQWMRRPRGPWVEMSVLDELQRAFPAMDPDFVGLLVDAGSANNLSAKSSDSPEPLKVCSYMEDCMSQPSERPDDCPEPESRRSWWQTLLRRLSNTSS